MTSSTESESGPLIEAGRVGRPHGLDGGFYVTGARTRLLQVGMSVRIGTETFEIERRGGTQRRPFLHLEGVQDREAARALSGQPIAVAAEHAPRLQEGEWWAHQLEGCEVRDGERLIGIVSKLVELPSCEALEVSREDEAALLVPMVKDAIRNVDPQRRLIEIDLTFLGDDL